MRHSDGTTVEISTSAETVTVELPGYEGCQFVIGFPPGGSLPNGFYVRTVDPDVVRLTPTMLRRVPYDRLFKVAAQERVKQLGEEAAPGAAPKRRYGGDDEHVRAVAEVYEWAVANKVPPRKAIAARWGKSEGTAGRWITEARKLGALPPYDEARKAK